MSGRRKGKELTAIELNYVDAYMEGEGTRGKKLESARAVGLSAAPKTIAVEAEIKDRQAKRAARSEVNQDWVMTRLERVVERCLQEVSMIRKGENAGQYKFDSSGALKALELIGKTMKMFTDKMELSGLVGLDDYKDLSPSDLAKRIRDVESELLTLSRKKKES